SLNNRGEPLSALDLIKNKLLAELEKKQVDSIEENFKKWNRLLENLTDNYSVQERYLRQYYNAFKFKDERGVKEFTFATQSNIIQIYEQLIDKDAKAIFGDLFEKAKLYNRIIAPNDDSVPQNVAQQFRDLERIGGSPMYVLLLYLLAERPNAELAAISKFLVKFFLRRSLTDQPPTRDLARNAITLIDVLRKKPKGDVLNIIQKEFRKQGWIASDDLFRAKLEGNLYDENVNATRFVLCKIEESHQTKEKFTDLWKRDSSGDYIWTVEHIFPQGPNIPQSWITMIAGGDEAKAKEYREQHVHKLGNLTITGYNGKLGNKSFTEKRDRKDTDSKFVGYKNGLHLNSELRKKDSWTVQDIETRTKSLVKEAIKLFAI
ncbi:MAG TPA: HNH endonuclease family protein, partial [Phycisphaerae bacterium]|nr:HNH endonuclease family protein [Phycisphaerae bacterium]